MEKSKLMELIAKPEDEYHDFKEVWYDQHKKDELVKDIFSFVNTLHYEDCYLIIGVENTHHHIVGVENDNDNRLNTQKLTDFMHSLPIANDHVPKVIVESLNVDKHIVDVVVIKNTSDVPVYLSKSKHIKGTKHPIHAGQIFTRENENNTSIIGTAADYQVSLLWKKRFALDRPIKEQYKVKLSDISHWEYFEYASPKIQQFGFQYDLDPDYCMFLEDDDEPRIKLESFSLNQADPRIDWQDLILKFRDRIIDDVQIVSLDGGRFLTVVPRISSINKRAIGDDRLPYRYLLADSLDYDIEKLFFNIEKGITAPSNNQFQKLFQGIVIFKNEEQRRSIENDLSQKWDYVKSKCTPSAEEVKRTQSSLSMHFDKNDREMDMSNIKYLCQEIKTAKFINDKFKPLS